MPDHDEVAHRTDPATMTDPQPETPRIQLRRITGRTPDCDTCYLRRSRYTLDLNEAGGFFLCGECFAAVKEAFTHD
jgi:hypothetical protein